MHVELIDKTKKKKIRLESANGDKAVTETKPEDDESVGEESNDNRSWMSICYRCNIKDRIPRKLLLCEGAADGEENKIRCKNVSHIKCANFRRTPEDEWLCKTCDPNYKSPSVSAQEEGEEELEEQPEKLVSLPQDLESAKLPPKRQRKESLKKEALGHVQKKEMKVKKEKMEKKESPKPKP